MGESTGQIVFINSHDYVIDVTGKAAVGCMAFMKTEGGKDVVLYTQIPALATHAGNGLRDHAQGDGRLF